jgi:hypothetical protein
MTAAVAEAAAERLAGRRSSRLRALFAAGVVFIAAGTATYRLLRSGGDDSPK